MKNRSYNTIVVFILFLCLTNLSKVQAQKEIGNLPPEVKAMATVTKDKILIRWGVTTPTAWKYSNKYGYTIERRTVVKDGIILKQPTTKLLTTTPLKPKPMMEWKEFTEKNMNAAIAAQALYGDQFDVTMNEGGNGVLSVINQAQVYEQRFTFAYYAADQDFEVAKFSGLAFVDDTIVEGEKYLYTIKVALPEMVNYKIKKGGVFLGTMNYRPLPKPQEFVGVFKDKTAILSWNFQILKRTYTNYIIQKSEDDGKTFKNLGNTPITTLGEKESKPSNRMMYVDSLFSNNKSYQYRIKGISPFGIEGPFSNIVSGKGIDPLVYNPFLTDLAFNDNGSATLNWEFPSQGINTLKKFELYRSDTPKGNYLLVNPSIAKNLRSINISNLQAVNYYKIVAIGNDGSKRESFPKMVQPDDNTPPEIPSELSGTIDSTGVVRINWKMNTEIDFLGYRVFRANLENDEFTQITFKPIPNSLIVDTINIKTLNKKVYYKVQAFDKRYNPSKFSQVLELKRPDIVPPTSPVFASFESNSKNVKLNWICSTSDDAKATLLYRKEQGTQSDWMLISELPLPINKYEDVSIQVGKTYLYTIITVDDSGLESEPIRPLKISISDNEAKEPIKRFNGTVNRESKYIRLDWSYNVKDIREYVLYKSDAENRPTLYKIFNAETKNYTDRELLINTKYTYLLQAVFNSGSKSPLKKITVNY